MKTGRLVNFWKKAEELPGMLALSLTKTIKMYPAVGWIRANQSASSEILMELNQLRKEKESLLGIIEENNALFKENDNTSSLNIEYCFKLRSKDIIYDTPASFEEIFKLIAPSCINPINSDDIKKIVSKFLKEKYNLKLTQPTIQLYDFDQIAVQLLANKLLEIDKTNTYSNYFWHLTKKGVSTMLKLRTVNNQAPISDS